MAPKLVLVGEAFGDEEVKQGRPFVGRAGEILEGMLHEVGLAREQVHLTNLLMEQPYPGGRSSLERNDFGRLYEDPRRKVPSPRLLEGVQKLHRELQALAPSVVVALGAEPLRWLTGHTGIGDWRGSVLPMRPLELSGPLPKVLPTYHPAAIARQWSWRPIAIHDLKKALAEAQFPEIRRAPRQATVHTPTARPGWPTFNDPTFPGGAQQVPSLEAALGALQALQQASLVAFDIETECLQPCSIAFAAEAHQAHVLPFFRKDSGSYWSHEEETQLWEAIRTLFQTTPVVGQNVHYDLWFLSELGIWPAHLAMDTMVAFHVLYPELPKGLEFLTSLYTDVAYYKWAGQTEDPPEFWWYNGMDAMVTWECARAIEQELRES